MNSPDVDQQYSLELPQISDVINDDTITDDDWNVGAKACAEGKVAIVISVGSLLGLEPIPPMGMPYLSHLIAQARAFAFGRDIDVPVIVSVSPELLNTIQTAVSSWAFSGVIPKVVSRPSTFVLKPLGGLLRGPDGLPVLTNTGPGDLAGTLTSSGVLQDMPDVEYFLVTSAANGLWTPHLGLLGQHIKSQSRITAEIVNTDVDDERLSRVLCWLNGTLQLVEYKHIMDVINVEEIPFKGSGSYIINRDVLITKVNWNWIRTRRAHVNSMRHGPSLGISWYRSLTQLTHDFPTRMVHVDRELRYFRIIKNFDLVELGKKLYAQTG